MSSNPTACSIMLHLSSSSVVPPTTYVTVSPSLISIFDFIHVTIRRLGVSLAGVFKKYLKLEVVLIVVSEMGIWWFFGDGVSLWEVASSFKCGSACCFDFVGGFCDDVWVCGERWWLGSLSFYRLGVVSFKFLESFVFDDGLSISTLVGGSMVIGGGGVAGVGSRSKFLGFVSQFLRLFEGFLRFARLVFFSGIDRRCRWGVGFVFRSRLQVKDPRGGVVYVEGPDGWWRVLTPGDGVGLSEFLFLVLKMANVFRSWFGDDDGER
ncbi:unnamed protein product [Amaranthus hypochondriacus]